MPSTFSIFDMTLGASKNNNDIFDKQISSSTALLGVIDNRLEQSHELSAIDEQLHSISSCVDSIKDSAMSTAVSCVSLQVPDIIVNEYLNIAGNFVSVKNDHSFRTGYLELSAHPQWRWRISTQLTSTTTYGLFDSSKAFLAHGPCPPGSDIVVLSGEISTASVMSQWPDARYIVFSQKGFGTMDIKVPAGIVSIDFIQQAISTAHEAINQTKISSLDASELVFKDFEFALVLNSYINRPLLKFEESTGYQRTEAIELKPGRLFKVSTLVGAGSVARYAFLKADGQIIWTLDNDGNTSSMVEYSIDCDAVAVDIPMATHFIACSQKGTQNLVIKKADKPAMLNVKDVVAALQGNQSNGWTPLDVALSNGYLDYKSRTIQQDSSGLGKYTEAIVVDASAKFRHSGASIGNVCTYAVFDANGNWLADGGYDQARRTTQVNYIDNIVDCAAFFDAGLPAKYIRFCSYGNSMYKPYVSKLETGKSSFNQKLHEAASSGDVLAGKKWLACGDSFTTPSGADMFDCRTMQPRSYPYFVQARNAGMTVLQPGGSGEAMSWDPFNPESNNRPHFCSKVNALSSEISSADYITFMYGLNEQKPPKPLSDYYDPMSSTYLSSLISNNEEFELSSYFIGNAIGHPAQVSDIMDHEALATYVFRGTQYGMRDDSHVDTIWGAWNTVLSAVFTYNPRIKAGIIITDGGIEDQQYETQLSIASWWGIPVLDLDRGPNVPLMIGGKTGMEINPFAKKLRQLAFAVSMSNFHPTEAGHKFRSTIVENFLRSL